MPSKQKEIYQYLADDIRKFYYPGAKLPNERNYAERLGVARKTLRYSLQRLEEERRIVRRKTGTYVLDEETGRCPQAREASPISILLPCPNYTEAANASSVVHIQDVIRGAMRAALEAGTRVVTIPVSENNDRDNINWNQLAGLGKDDIVLLTGAWYYRVIPVLTARKCRIGCIVEQDRIDMLDFSGATNGYLVYIRKNWQGFLTEPIDFLKKSGAGKIAAFMAMAPDCADLLEKWHKSGSAPNFTFGITDHLLSFDKQMNALKTFCRNHKFDALILDMNSTSDRHIDLYQELALPLSVKLVINSRSFLGPHPRPNMFMYYDPYLETGYTLTKSLLSGGTNGETRRMENKFYTTEEAYNEK